jgi:two-component system, NarL family, response regulator LiaR
MPPVRILLADDHALVRAGVRLLLSHVEGARIVAEAHDGHQAVDLAALHRPDVAFVDVEMPGFDGIEAARRIREASPDTRVVMLSMHGDGEFVSRALRAGATGYVMKDVTPQELELALRSVLAGGIHLSSRASREMVERHVHPDRPAEDPLERLTPRQREVLRLIAEGQNTKRIAASLAVSAKTVETHRAQLMERLGMRDIPSLVRLAVRTGLVE